MGGEGGGWSRLKCLEKLAHLFSREFRYGLLVESRETCSLVSKMLTKAGNKKKSTCNIGLLKGVREAAKKKFFS